MSEENLELVRRGYEAFNSGDVEQAVALWDEEIEIAVPPAFGIGAGPYHGHGGGREWYREWMESFGDYTAEIVEMQPIGDRHVVTLAHQSAKGRGSGAPVEAEYGNLFEIRQGKLLAIHVFPTFDEAVEAAERREANPDFARPSE
jgi:ketosteroid isomerase-like protein